MGGQSAEKAVIRDRKNRDKVRELGDPFLGIYQVWGERMILSGQRKPSTFADMVDLERTHDGEEPHM